MISRPVNYHPAAVECYQRQSQFMSDSLFDWMVSLPRTYQDNPEREYPLLLVLDGYYAFPTVSQLSASMAAEEIEDIIVVGVDIPASVTSSQRIRRRVHQFTPEVVWEMEDELGRSLKDFFESDASSEFEPYTGGAQGFFDFLCFELLTELKTRYRILNNDIGLAAYSAGGFFGASCLFRESSPFSKYVLASPALGYCDGEIFRREAFWAECYRNLPAQVYMAVGSLEQGHAQFDGRFRIAEGTRILQERLNSREYPNLNLTFEVIENAQHSDCYFVALARGLRRFYKKEME